jgi:hypothetical protein
LHRQVVDPAMRRPQRQSHPDQDEPAARIEIQVDVHGRWDALALSELLIPYQSFLVQHDHERWVVHARAPGCHGESLSQALAAIEEWRGRRHLRLALCRVGGRPRHFDET